MNHNESYAKSTNSLNTHPKNNKVFRTGCVIKYIEEVWILVMRATVESLMSICPYDSLSL